jgi:hypothetical protein
MQLLRGLAVGAIVGGLLYGFLIMWMHAIDWLAAISSVALALAIMAVVGTGRDERGIAADAAWRAAAPDLPPVMDRVAIERAQVHLPGPRKPGRPAAADRQTGTGPDDASDVDSAAIG